MAIQTTQVPLVFTQGADTKTDSKNTAFTSFQVMRNSRYSKLGVAVPRGGFTNFVTLPGTGSSDIVADNDYILAKNGNSLYTVGLTGTSSRLGSEMPGGYMRWYGGDAAPLSGTVLAVDTTVVHAWIPPENASTMQVGIAVYEAATGRVIVKTLVNLASVNNIQLMSLNGTTYLVYETSTFQLRANSLDLTNPTSTAIIGGTVTWTNQPTGTTAIRWSTAVVGTNAYIVYSLNNSADVNLQILSNFFTATAGVLKWSFAEPANALAITPVTTQGAATVMIAATSDGSTGTPVVQAGMYTSANTLVGTLQTSVTGLNSIVRVWAYETTVPVYGISTSATIAQSNTYDITSSSILQRPALMNGTLPVSGSSASDLIMTDTYTEVSYGSQGLLQLKSGVASLVATLGVGMNVGQSTAAVSIQLPNPVVVGTKTFFVAPIVSSVDGILAPSLTAADTFSKTTLTVKTQSTLIVWDSSELLNSYLDRSNQQALYIGASSRVTGVTERPGTPWPEMPMKIGQLSVTTGNFALNDVVSYIFAKVWRSAAGVEYRSYGTIYTVKYSAAKTLAYTLTSSDFATYFQPVTRVELYRTEANGQVFYLANTRTVPGSYTDPTPVATGNDPILGARTADINGNELPPQATTSSRATTSFGDRIAVVSADKPSTILFNRPAPYPVGTSFANGLEVEVSAEGGDITAIQDMDSALYVFKANDIYTLYGDPAGATGENSSLGTPKVLFNGVGCTEPRAVILTPKGIVFKSGKGFYILARNQSLDFIGEGPFTAAGNVTGSSIAQNQYEAIFTYSSGSTWVLNLDTRAWYEWTTALPFRGSAMSNGSLYTITDTTIVKYDETVNTDSGTQYGQVLTTGWIRPNQIRGFQRVRRMYVEGSTTRTTQITVDVFVDYQPGPVQTFNFNLTARDPMQLDLHLAVQKCEAMQFRFTTDRGGLTLSGATLEVGIKEGPDKSRSSSTNSR